MPIDTNTEKLALMEMEDIWEPGLPLSPGALGQDDRQQLLWGYPGLLWLLNVQYARPDADLADGSWTPSVALAPLFEMLDEVSADDADYITSGAAPVHDTAILSLSSVAPPDVGTVTVRVRARLE